MSTLHEAVEQVAESADVWRQAAAEWEAAHYSVKARAEKAEAQVDQLQEELTEARLARDEARAQVEADVACASGPLSWACKQSINGPPPSRAVAELADRFRAMQEASILSAVSSPANAGGRCRHEKIVEDKRFPDGSIDGKCEACGETGFPIRDVPYEQWVASGDAPKCGGIVASPADMSGSEVAVVGCELCGGAQRIGDAPCGCLPAGVFR